MMKTDDKIGCGFIVIWGLCFLAGIAFWGVILWGIIKLVTHYT
jgi:hypothetical protein